MFARCRPRSHPRFLASATTFLVVLAVSLYGGVWSAEHPGEAAFPGANGKIAFVSYRAGNREIYVMNSDGTDQRRLTDGPGDSYNPTWSPRFVD